MKHLCSQAWTYLWHEGHSMQPHWCLCCSFAPTSNLWHMTHLWHAWRLQLFPGKIDQGVVKCRSRHRTHVYIDHIETRLYIAELWLRGSHGRDSVNKLDNAQGSCHRRVDLHGCRVWDTTDRNSWYQTTLGDWWRHHSVDSCTGALAVSLDADQRRRRGNCMFRQWRVADSHTESVQG